MIDLLPRALRPVRFRGKSRLLHKFWPHEGQRVAEIFGYRMELDLKDYIQRSIFLGVFEPEETRMVRRYLRLGMTFVDVGANVGYYSLLAASIGCQVFAFEPSPYAYQKLTEVISHNKISRITPIQAGLSNREGEIDLYIGKSGRNHTPTMIPNDGGYPVRVPILRFDDYARKIPRIDLMKIDVEGFEPNVIEGAAESIKQGRIGALLCEFNEDWLRANGTSSRGFHEQLTGLGFVSSKPDFALPNQNLFLTWSGVP